MTTNYEVTNGNAVLVGTVWVKRRPGLRRHLIADKREARIKARVYGGSVVRITTTREVLEAAS